MSFYLPIPVANSSYSEFDRSTMNDPSSLVPITSLDHKVVEMVSFPVSGGVIDYFLDTLTTTVARATIARPYKAAFDLKTTVLVTLVTKLLERSRLDTRTIITALMYFSRVRLQLEENMEDWICERLAIGALMIAHKNNNDQVLYKPLEHWVALVQHVKKADVARIERDFLRLIDYRTTVRTADLLAHYDGLKRRVLMHKGAYDLLSRPSIFTRPERTTLLPNPIPDTRHAASGRAIPDLMYPESESDGYSSDEHSPPVITPPASTALNGHAHSRTNIHHNKPHPYSRPAYSKFESGMPMDPATEARVRYYAGDYGTVAHESGGPPRYVPYSHSHSRPHTQSTRAYRLGEPYDPAPTPPPKSWRRRGSRAHREDEEGSDSNPDAGCHPWRQFQNWKSAMSRDTTWGTFGLFNKQ